MRPGIALIGLLVCLLSGIWLTGSGAPAQAATTERVVVNRFSGVAIEGFDPVAYFVDGAAARGRAQFEASLWGAVCAEAGTIQPTIAASASAARRDAKVMKEPLVPNPVASLTWRQQARP